MSERHVQYEDARKDYAEIIGILGRAYQEGSEEQFDLSRKVHLGRIVLENMFPELKIEFK